MQEIEIDAHCGTRNLTDFDFTNYTVQVIEYCDVSYKDFFKNFMSKNLPCVIKNVSNTWECSNKWIMDNKINFDYLKQNYGQMEAPVAKCNDISYNSQTKINMKVSDYVLYLEQEEKEDLLYLKDWHLRKLKPNDRFYDVPIVFASDWLNEIAIDSNEDDFMFVYIGPKGSWTPLHADVYSSYSWSVNVIGQKKWILFPPGEEEKLKDTLGNLPLLFSPDKYNGIKYFELIQNQGEAIFVPSGWHHQVLNLMDTISINHNWINACNIESVWKALNTSLLSVENEIKEFKNTPDFTNQCQLILKSLFGMDFSSFVQFICQVANKRLTQLHGNANIYFNKFRLGINHIKFDLNCISKIIDLIYCHSLFLNKAMLKNVEENFNDVKYRISQIHH